MRKLLVSLFVVWALLCTTVLAAAPTGYQEKETLFQADFSQYAVGGFPADAWASLGANVPADLVFKIANDPVDKANRVLFSPFMMPGTAGNSYIVAPKQSADTPYLLVEFDLYMAKNKQDVAYNSGIYLFGIADWPPHSQVYIRPDQNTVELDRWLHYTWVIDASKNITSLYIDNKLVKENVKFRTNGLDTKNFRVAFWSKDGLPDIYFDNVKISSLVAK